MYVGYFGSYKMHKPKEHAHVYTYADGERRVHVSLKCKP